MRTVQMICSRYMTGRGAQARAKRERDSAKHQARREASRLLIACVTVAVLLLINSIDKAQAQEFPASKFADDAYHELALKNYTTAIDNFKKALAQEPSNVRWRKDLGYAYMTAESPRDAVREFATVYRADRGDLSIALQLGYLSLQLMEYDEAEKYFNDAIASSDKSISNPARAALAELQATRVRARKQQAYDLLLKNRREEAIRIFEQVHEVDPTDAGTTLQLGYMYFAAGQDKKARTMFLSVRGNSNHEIASRAETALAEINRESKWWFGSIYAAPTYQSRFSNQINTLNAKFGVRPSPHFEPYVGLRVSRDVRSKAGRLPEIYSDNSAVLAFGIQSRFPKIGTTFYGEAGTARSLLSHSHQTVGIPDYRAGMILYRGWGKPLSAVAQENSSRFSWTGSGYGDASYYTRYNHNVIGYAQLRHGVNLPGVRVLPIQVLAAANFVKDSNREFYNNLAEGGPVVRISPFYSALHLQLEGQYMRGFYALHDPSNPYGAQYRDVRLLLTWSVNF